MACLLGESTIGFCHSCAAERTGAQGWAGGRCRSLPPRAPHQPAADSAPESAQAWSARFGGSSGACEQPTQRQAGWQEWGAMLSPPRFHKTKESGREKPVAPPHTPGMGEGSWAVSPLPRASTTPQPSGLSCLNHPLSSNRRTCSWPALETTPPNSCIPKRAAGAKSSCDQVPQRLVAKPGPGPGTPDPLSSFQNSHKMLIVVSIF